MNKGARFHFVPDSENDVAGPGFTVGAWISGVLSHCPGYYSTGLGGREVRAFQVHIPLTQHLHFAIRRVQRHVSETIHLASFIT